MGRRRMWFLRPRTGVVDPTQRALQDGDVPGRFRRLAVEDAVPDLRATSRCDGAIVYERPEERRAALAANQRAESDDRSRPTSDTRVEVEREGADG